MASQYKNVTVDGKEIDSEGSLFQVLDNRDSGLPKNIPNVFKCNLLKSDGTSKFKFNYSGDAMDPVAFSSIISFRDINKTDYGPEVLLYKNDDVYLLDQYFSVIGIAYINVPIPMYSDNIIKVSTFLNNTSNTYLIDCGDGKYETGDAESKFSILAEEEITSEKVSRGFVGCYNCNDGYPNNLEDCPYCSGRGRFYGQYGGYVTAPYIVDGDGNFGGRAVGTTFVNDKLDDTKKYLASNAVWQLAVDIEKDNTAAFYEKLDYESRNIFDPSVLLTLSGVCESAINCDSLKFNIPGEILPANNYICRHCNGRGYIDKIYQKCNACNGLGYSTTVNGDMITWWLSCIHCNNPHEFSGMAGLAAFKNSYSKLTYNMTDETMPILRGKRLKNNFNVGYNDCPVCDGRGALFNVKDTNSDDPTLLYTNIYLFSPTKEKLFSSESSPTDHLFRIDNMYYGYDNWDNRIRNFVNIKTEKNDLYLTAILSTGKLITDKISNFYVKYDAPKNTLSKLLCTECNGTGHFTDGLCNACCGQGYIHEHVYDLWEKRIISFADSNLSFYSTKHQKKLNLTEFVDLTIKENSIGNTNLFSTVIENNYEENRLQKCFEDLIGKNTDVMSWARGNPAPPASGNKVSFLKHAWGYGGWHNYRGYYTLLSGFRSSTRYVPCPACFNDTYFVNSPFDGTHHRNGYDDAEIQNKKELLNFISAAAKDNGIQYQSSFKQTHFYNETELKASAYSNECGVTAFCDTCNPNGVPETHFKDGLIVNPNSQGTYPKGTETVVGLIDCNTCGNNGLEAGEIVCTGCLGIRHWFCTTCSGDGEVEYRPTVAYEDGKKVAVGDGYYYENLFPNATSAFNLYKDYINIKPNDNCDIGRGEYIKKMNLFSVENNGLLTVHNNNYDDVPTSDVKHNLNRDFFAVRDWAKYDSLDERFANLQNCCYAPDAIYFPKRTAHNEEWKLRIRELYYLITDSYIKTNASMLKTNALNQAIADFYTNNTTYLLKLGPIITYAIKGVWRKGAKGSKGVKGVTAGTKGKKGMKGLKGLKGTKGAKGYYEKIVIENKQYKYTLPDILNAIYAEYGQRIMNSGNLGKDDKTYTFYCINEDSENYLWFKGVRIRQLTKGRYQTLNVVKGCKPYGVQRIVYKNNGYNGEYGVMNFQYSRNREFLT